MRRQVPTPGLSYVDANPGRLVTFQDDVLGYKTVIQSRWPELQVVWDVENLEWVLIQTDKTGEQSLLFATKLLGEGTLERLDRCDNSKSDPFDAVESWNARIDKEQEYQNSQRIGAIGEKLAWAIRKDEFNGPSPRIFYAAEKQQRLVDVSQ